MYLNHIWYLDIHFLCMESCFRPRRRQNGGLCLGFSTLLGLIHWLKRITYHSACFLGLSRCPCGNPIIPMPFITSPVLCAISKKGMREGKRKQNISWRGGVLGNLTCIPPFLYLLIPQDWSNFPSSDSTYVGSKCNKESKWGVDFSTTDCFWVRLYAYRKRVTNCYPQIPA